MTHRTEPSRSAGVEIAPGDPNADDGGLAEPVRPLAFPGRAARVMPFALVAAVAIPLVAFSPVQRPAALLAASVGLAGLVAAALLLPWRRWPPWAELLPVYGFFAVVLLLRETSGGSNSGYAALAMLPVVWLALYHSRTQMLGGLALQVLVFLAPTVIIGPPTYPVTELRRTIMMVLVSAVIGVTTHELVARGRRDARALAIAGARVRRERDFTSAVLDSADCLVMVLDRECRVRWFNRACERITGRRLGEAVGAEPWHIFAGMADSAAAQEAYSKVLAGRYPQRVEHDWLARDGSRRRVASTCTALRDHDGTISHVVVTGLDLTERRRLERLFADVLAAATEQAIIGADLRGVVTVFNVGAERLLGYRSEEVLEKLTLEAFHNPADFAARAADLDAPPGIDILVGRARSGVAETREWTYRRKDGRTVPVSVTVSPMRDDTGEVTGFLAVARDVSVEHTTTAALVEAYERERDAADRLRELDRARNEFISSVSHDLRTPLTSVLGYIEMLVDGDAGDLPSDQRRLLEVAHRNAQRLSALVQDILLMSRIESGLLLLDRRPVSLDKVIDNTLEAVIVPAGRAVRLDVSTPSQPLFVDADEDQLERALTNLVGNAVKFTPDGGRVEVAASADVGMATVRVSDTGIGIPPEDLPNVFAKFYRSSNAQRQGLPGTGLGLAIAKAIIEAHGGAIEAASEPGEGTTMAFTLALVPPTAMTDADV